MKRDLKPKIRKAARFLFNEKGYDAVSMREIADAVGISVGNLTYHYPKKEALVEAVILEMHSRYRPMRPCSTLQELNATLLRMESTQAENAFYFWHYTQLAQISGQVREIQSRVIGDKQIMLSESLGLLCRSGLLKEEEYPGQHAALSHAMLIATVYWTTMDKTPVPMKRPGHLAECLWGVLYPALTPEGKEMWQREIPTQDSMEVNYHENWNSRFGQDRAQLPGDAPRHGQGGPRRDLYPSPEQGQGRGSGRGIRHTPRLYRLRWDAAGRNRRFRLYRPR